MRKISSIALGFILGHLSVAPAYAKDTLIAAADHEFDEILARDISGLTVTSVAKRSQRLSDTAAAVYVITQEELRRAGIYSIPEALRLVPGMQVAKANSDFWAVSSRGFNSTLSNKLLVLIDGRAIYTPVFSGVYWGDQSTTINDIERIEVIRGPGASLYGANAVNGVVNIITKSAEDTQGNMLSAAVSSKGRGVYEARHGGQLSNNDYYRTYAQYYDASTWARGRAGFRMDGKGNDKDTYTFQGEAYGGEQNARTTTPTVVAPFSQTVFSTDDAYGGNVLGRWNHKISPDSELSLQGYIDHYGRQESNFKHHITTGDVQLQHSVRLDDRNNFIWGGGARLYYQELSGTFSANVRNRFDTHEIFNVFVQDEYAVVPETLYLTVGSKFEHNDFTGIEVQPSARLAWHPTDNQTVWGALSRAVRTPSSIERDLSNLALVTAGPTEFRITGNPNQKSEELIAYELGHRIQAASTLSFDTALFYNDYENLATLSAGAPFIGLNGNTVNPFPASNLGKGHVWGAEFSATWNVTKDWRLDGSYTYLRMDLDVKPGAVASLESSEALAPRNQFAIQSYYNLLDSVQWDNMLYYVDDRTTLLKNYVRYDTRIAWLVQPGVEVSFIGRNLVDPHKEFATTPQTEIDRSYIGQILWKF